MPDAAHPPDLTIEEQLRAAQGVLLLVAELFELHSLTPDGAGHPASPRRPRPPWPPSAGNTAKLSTGW